MDMAVVLALGLVMCLLRKGGDVLVSAHEEKSYSTMDPASAMAKNETTAINLIERLLSKLDNRVRPNIYGPPLQVKCDFYVQSFGSINEVDMDFEINVFFRQRWYDERLKFTDQESPVAVPFRYIDRFWLPDIFFPNEKSASFHDVVVPNQVIKIFPDGLVRYSARMTLKLACPMYLLNFPLDYQDCFLKVSSYSYTEADVVLEWLQPNPLEINVAELSLPQFELLKNSTGRCEESLSTGSFSCLKATFSMKRQVGFYVLQTYIPSMLIVSLSWVSFWISKDAVPARITLGVTTVLTMTTQLSSSRSATMKVSYPKAIDVWYAFCMLLVFGALVEYAFVNVLVRRKPPKKKRGMTATGPSYNHQPSKSIRHHVDVEDTSEEPLNDKTVIEMAEEGYNNHNHVHAADDSDTSSRGLTSEGLDRLARILFPITFLIFNVVYWILYSQPNVIPWLQSIF